MRLVVRPEAEADLLRGYSWYEQQLPGLGVDFLDEVSQCQLTIEQRPLSFAIVHDPARRAMTRRFPYALFFVVGKDVVSIVAAFHQTSNPDALALRLEAVAQQTHGARRDG